MAKDKKAFIFYSDWRDTFNQLPNEKAGELIKFLLAYVNDEDPKTDDVLINAVFASMKNTLKRDLKKFESKKKQWSDAGKASAEARKKKKETDQRNSTDVKNVATNPTVSDSVNVSDSVTDNVKEKEINKNVFSEKIHDTLKNCLVYFPRHLHPNTKQKKINCLETIEKLNRIDKIPFELIENIVKKTRADHFWAQNFLSITKLRKTNKEGLKYIIVFNEKIKTDGKTKSNGGATDEQIADVWAKKIADANKQG